MSARENKTNTPFGMADEPRRPRPPSTLPAEVQSIEPHSLKAHLRLAMLEHEIGSCTRCPLHEGRKRSVFARGNPDAKVMFVGEAPSTNDDETGQPFTGRAGGLLDRMIAAMGLGAEDFCLVTLCRCHTPKNRTPTDEEMAACAPYLHEQIALVQPRVIVALGATATKGLLNSKLGIKALRGHWKLYNGEIPVMPTYHPAFLLRETEAGNLNAKRDVWRDLQAVMERLGRPVAKTGAAVAP
jgi:DNA polymerase